LANACCSMTVRKEKRKRAFCSRSSETRMGVNNSRRGAAGLLRLQGCHSRHRFLCQGQLAHVGHALGRQPKERRRSSLIGWRLFSHSLETHVCANREATRGNNDSFGGCLVSGLLSPHHFYFMCSLRSQAAAHVVVGLGSCFS
jgi:hypothetical protein